MDSKISSMVVLNYADNSEIGSIHISGILNYLYNFSLNSMHLFGKYKTFSILSFDNQKQLLFLFLCAPLAYHGYFIKRHNEKIYLNLSCAICSIIDDDL